MELLSMDAISAQLGLTRRAVRHTVAMENLQHKGVGKSEAGRPVKLYCLAEFSKAREAMPAPGVNRSKRQGVGAPTQGRRLRPPSINATARMERGKEVDFTADGIELRKQLRGLWRMVYGNTR